MGALRNRWVYEATCGCVLIIAAANLSKEGAQRAYLPSSPGKWVEMDMEQAVARFSQPCPGLPL